MNAIQSIEQLGIPTNSFISAVRYMRDNLTGLTQNEYNSMYHRIAGVESTSNTETEAYYNFMYLVQTIVKDLKNAIPLPIDVLIQQAKEAADQFMIDYDFAINSNTRTEIVTEIVDGVETQVVRPVVKKQTSNKDVVKGIVENPDNLEKTKNEFIELIMKQLKVTKANAGVYLYNYYKNNK